MSSQKVFFVNRSDEQAEKKRERTVATAKTKRHRPMLFNPLMAVVECFCSLARPRSSYGLQWCKFPNQLKNLTERRGQQRKKRQQQQKQKSFALLKWHNFYRRQFDKTSIQRSKYTSATIQRSSLAIRSGKCIFIFHNSYSIHSSRCRAIRTDSPSMLRRNASWKSWKFPYCHFFFRELVSA